jgi:hypothetical protein
MKATRSRIVSLALAVGVVVMGAAATVAAVRCVLDQQMWINGGGDGFGGAAVLGQTFVPSAPGRVCKVVVWIHKNNPAAGPLTLRLRRHDRTLVPGGSLTLPPAAIPMGLSAQSFNFACDPLLAGSPFYGLTLEAPGSPPAAYTWINSDDAGADAVYAAGHGWYNANGNLPGSEWKRSGYDYAFRVYLCRD